MASYYKLPIEIRTGSGASLARELRRNGKIPANYYYSGEANQNLAIDKKAFNHAIHSGQQVFEVDINNETIYIMIKDIQYHSVTEEVMHVDLMRIRRTEKMTFSIPLVLEGDAVGIDEGGIVAQVATTIDVECFPNDVPESITVDISGLEFNSAMAAEEIVLPVDTLLISAENTTIVTCNPPKAEVEPEPVEDEEIELAEGEETTDEETTDEDSKSDEKPKKDADQDESSEES
ncbi:MAG: 50S ribosomal protein L25 [Candidatus Marinimicrobia bacterium]|jgi:large subunit ribosomal protein L25|nr:50S ribosomal protein L25 [Candidatus Neomarinimicrobiota bacterium]